MGEAENTEYLKLPVDERCVHKLWKARVSGYEDAAKLFNQWDEDDPNWKKYHGSIKKFITDSNAIAQEKGLEAALAFVENCVSAGRIAGDCAEGVITKCLGAPKPKTKELGNQILLMFVEIEQVDKITDELVKGLEQKNPKVVSGCISCMTSCLKTFGAKVMKVSPFLKAIVPLLDHRDKGVRDEGKLLIVEAYRWVGDIMKQQLNGLKPVMLAELETEFQGVAGGKARPERLLRSQQSKGFDPEDAPGGADSAGGGGEEDGDGDAEEADSDPYDLLDPVDILDKLPKNFYELVEEKKWQLRKEALDALYGLVTQTPKIQPGGDYGELIRTLKKFISKDTNVMLVALAAQCSAGLAKGLRSHFKQGASHLLPAALEKFREKKANVVAGLVEAVDAFFLVLGIEGVQEDCLASMKHKTPSVVLETAKYLARCFATCPAPLLTNKKMLKGYISALSDLMANPDAGVREGSFEALGVLVKAMGEPAVLKQMSDLDPLKQARIKEFADKTELTGKFPRSAASAAQPTADSGGKPTGPKVVKSGGAMKQQPAAAKKSVGAKPGSTQAVKTAAAVVAAPAEPGTQRAASAATGPAARKASASNPGGVKARAVSSAGAGSSRKKEEVDTSPPYIQNGLKAQRFKDETRLKLLKWNFAVPRQEFLDQLKDQMVASSINSTLITQMWHSDFKQHLKALETLSKYLNSDFEGLISNLDLLLKWITLRFFETNPSVLLKALEYLNDVFAVLKSNSYSLHDIEAVSFVPYLVSKVGDPKDQVRSSIRTIFKSMCEVYPASKFSPFLMEGLKHKNAKLRAECLEEIGVMLKTSGINILQPAPAANLKEVAKSISDRDNSVRNAALNTITEAFFLVGEKMYKMVGSLPEKDMAMLEERIKRVSKTRPPPGAAQSAPPPSNTLQHQPLQQQQQQQQVTENGAKSSIPSASGATGVPRFKNFRQFPAPGTGIPIGGEPLAAAAAADAALGGLRKSPSGGGGFDPASRPKSGVFSLDLDKIETSYHENGFQGGRTSVGNDSGNSNGVGPRLVNHQGLDDILNDNPIALPATMANKRFSPPGSFGLSGKSGGTVNLPASGVVLSGAKTSVPISESSEAMEALDLVISQLFNTADAGTCLSAMAEIEELLKDKSKVFLLESRVDQVLMACYMQYRHALNNRLGGRTGSGLGQADDPAANKETLRIFQYVVMVLMSVYHHPSIARNASTSSLHDLLHVIFSFLVDSKVKQLPPKDEERLVRAVNVLAVKMVERSDPTNVTSAFLRLLRESVGNGGVDQKFIQLILKCLWKAIRFMPQWVEARDINIDVTLADLHEFLKNAALLMNRDEFLTLTLNWAYPSVYWKTQASDLPIRTIKTLLHQMATVKGDSILDHLTRVNDPSSSELVAYLHKLLTSGIGGGKENVANTGGTTGSSAPLGSSTSPSSKLPRLTKSEHEDLAEIFKKIGQKETSRLGLQELHSFKRQNPQATLEPFLERSSPYFRNYIEQGLAAIDAETASGSSRGGSSLGDAVLTDATFKESNLPLQYSESDYFTGSDAVTGGAVDSASSSAASAPHAMYLEKLNRLRIKGGLGVNSGSEGSKIGSGLRAPSSTSVVSSTSSSSISTIYRLSSASVSSEVRSEAPRQRPPSSAIDPPSSSAKTSSEITSADLDDYRKRLERLRQSAF